MNKKSEPLYVWSGSGVLKKEILKRELKAAQELGFELSITPEVLKYSSKPFNKKLPFLAGDEKIKIQELKKILSNIKAHCLLATRGGYGVFRLLPYLDKLNYTKRNPLLVWGYSDLTILQLYFYSKYKWPYIQGPLLGSTTFSDPKPVEKDSLKKLAYTLNFETETKTKALTRFKLKSQKLLILGGNLASIATMLGTQWEPQSHEKYILFLEDIAEPAYKLDRLLQQLLYSHFYKNCVGIVLGHFTDCPDYLKIFNEFSIVNKIPVYTGLEMGHESPRIPLLLGKKIDVFSKNKSLLLRWR